MKLMFVLLISLGVVGCGRFERIYTHWTGSLTYKCSRNGVEYVQSDSGLAPSLDKEGNVVTCH